MSNQKKAIEQKIPLERNKKVWLVKNKKGKTLDSFRQKITANKFKKEKEELMLEELFLVRDNSLRENMKEALT